VTRPIQPYGPIRPLGPLWPHRPLCPRSPSGSPHVARRRTQAQSHPHALGGGSAGLCGAAVAPAGRGHSRRDVRRHVNGRMVSPAGSLAGTRIPKILRTHAARKRTQPHRPGDGTPHAGALARRNALLPGLAAVRAAFSQTRPDTIYIMAGINDLRHGATDVQVLANIRTMIRRLKQTHPRSRIVVQSILPTRWASLPGSRIERLNRLISETAQIEGVIYLDLFYDFANSQGMLRRDLTTDGLHLSDKGYQVWHAALQRSGL